MEKYIQGTVRNITFYNEDNAFAILKIDVTDSNLDDSLFGGDKETVAVKGYLPQPKKGEEFRFYGEAEYHEKFGRQFKFVRYEKIEETNKEGIIDYLSSDLFKGVGEKTAERVVNFLGKDAITKITQNKAVLDKVPKLSEKAKESLYEGLKEHKANEQTLIKLYDYGITPRIAKRILDAYADKALGIIRKNPYKLIDDIEGIGFERADLIAKKLGFKDDDPLRIRAMIVYLFNHISNQKGHTHIERDVFLDVALERLNKHAPLVGKETMESILNDLVDSGRFIVEAGKLSQRQFVKSENTIARVLREFSEKTMAADAGRIETLIADFERVEGITYTRKQKKAIQTAMKSQVMVLNGGPGTGKTTVIKGIVHVFKNITDVVPPAYEKETDIHLIAPTGRAAKRMKETTGYHASTIHRFLGYGFDGSFEHDKDHPKPGRLFIIDEASMIDVMLGAHLFESLPEMAKIIIVGDEAQLPSVGPGQVLKDIIDSGAVRTITLDTIHRQAANSAIIHLANEIRRGRLPDDLYEVYPDRYVFKESQENFKPRLKKMIDYMLDQGFDLLDDIQVLIPMYRGPAGIDAINAFLQTTYNKGSAKSLQYGDKTFKINDKVLQLINRAEDGVMNGDQGRVVGIDVTGGILYVDFLGNEVTYRKGDLDQLTHAYAMSIHKSQGSEYKVVILPLFKSFSIMLKRKLIYTAVSRAKEKLIVAGDLETLRPAVGSLEENRQTMLRMKLEGKQDDTRVRSLDEAIEKLREKPERKTINDPEIPFDTLGEELNEKTPYDFLDES